MPGRTPNRTAMLLRGMVTSLGARLIGAIAPIALIPLALPYVGSERYGVWMTVVSLSAMLVWADLGLGNTLLTQLTPLVAGEEWGRARQTVGTAYALLAKVSLCLLALSVASFWVVPWGRLLNADAEASPSAIAAVCLVAFSGNIVASLVHRVCYAMDRVSLSNLVLALSSLLSLAVAAAGVAHDLAPHVLIGAVLLTPCASNVVFTLVFFARNRQVRPRGRLEGAPSRRLLTLSAGFFLLSVTTTVALNADNFVIARVLGAEWVTSYSVTQRLFLILVLLANVVNLPLWPANSRALEQGDVAWVVSTTKRAALWGGAAAAGAGAVIWLLGPFITQLLSGDVVRFDPLLGAGFVVWATLSALSSPLFMVQNSLGRVGWQLGAWVSYLALSIPLKVWVVSMGNVAWVPWVSAVVYLALVIPGCWYGYRAAMASVTRTAAPA